MVWKGVVIEESLTDKSILEIVKIMKTRKATLEGESERGNLTFLYIELEDERKDDFVRKAVSSMKDRFYIHVCKGAEMVVIYRNRNFEFSADETDKINEARDYGLSIGILEEQLPSEHLIKNPYG